jgi:hypothetical protein
VSALHTEGEPRPNLPIWTPPETQDVSMLMAKRSACSRISGIFVEPGLLARADMESANPEPIDASGCAR